MNVDGKRFVDEGADFRNYTYAKYGKQILFQPERAAFQLFDQKTLHLLRDEYRIPQVTKGEADTIEELADQLGIDPDGLAQTVAEYNAACQPGDYNPTVLDGVHTENIEPPKTNWALPLDTPPYEGYAVTCGITFTFGGLRIDRRAQVMDTTDNPIPGLYAAERSSAASSTTTTPAARASCRARSSARSLAPQPPKTRVGQASSFPHFSSYQRRLVSRMPDRAHGGGVGLAAGDTAHCLTALPLPTLV